MALKHFNKGDVIFREGDEGSSFFQISSGKVAVFVNYETNDELKMAELGSGQIFGEMAALEGFKRSGTVVVSEDNTTVVEVPEKEFETFFEENPNQIIQVMKQISARIRSLTKEYTAVTTELNQIKTGAGKKQDESFLSKIKKLFSGNKRNLTVEELREANHSKGITTGNVNAYPAGTVIFKEGDDANCMYDIHTGRVGIYTDYGTPNEKMLTDLYPNKFFGEMGMIDAEPRSATAVTLDNDTTLEVIYPDDLVKLIKDNPPKVDMIIQHLCHRLRRLTADYAEACEELCSLSN